MANLAGFAAAAPTLHPHPATRAVPDVSTCIRLTAWADPLGVSTQGGNMTRQVVDEPSHRMVSGGRLNWRSS